MFNNELKPNGIYFPVHNVNLKSGTADQLHYTFMWDYWIYKTSTHFEDKDQQKPRVFLFSTQL